MRRSEEDLEASCPSAADGGRVDGEKSGEPSEASPPSQETAVATDEPSSPAAGGRFTSERIATGFCHAVIGAVVAAAVLAALVYEFKLITTGELQVSYPNPIYALMPIPGTATTARGAGAGGADFSQVFFSAMALRHGQSAYRPTSLEFADPFRRLSGYPPLTNWAYVPLSYLPYRAALLIHSVASLLLLLGASALLLRFAGLSRHIGRVLLVQGALYLFSPVGLTHLERGQFDLIVAAACVLAMACLLLARPRLGVAAAAGLLGAIKWTAVPLLGACSMLGFLFSGGRKRLSFLLIALVMVAVTLIFGDSFFEYLGVVRYWELAQQPIGLTLQHILPRSWVKLLPLVLTVMLSLVIRFRVAPASRRARILPAVALPFGLALVNISVCFTTISYEYHTVILLGMVPCLVVWTANGDMVSPRKRVVTNAAFGAHLVVAFRLFDAKSAISVTTMTWIYAGLTVCFFITALLVAMDGHRVHQANAAAGPSGAPAPAPES